jgi:hypothetical protein
LAFLETSGVTNCTSGCTLPVTGSCTAAGWQVNTNTCSDSTTVNLNNAYAAGSDIYFDPIGYTGQGSLHTGGFDCGSIAAYVAAHNMAGVLNWFDDNSAQTKLCFNTTQPSISGGYG